MASLGKDSANGSDPQVESDAQVTPAASLSDELDAQALFRAVWRRRWWIALATALVSVAAVAYALLATQWYSAETVLLPREGGVMSGVSGRLAQLGGLIDIAGLNVGQTSKQEPLGVLRSVGFARRFIERNDLVEILSAEAGSAVSRSDEGPEQRLQRLAEEFGKSVLSVSEDRRTGLVTVAVEWLDAQTAADWANGITGQINEEMRERALDEGSRNIAFLRDQLAHTETVSLQQAIGRLIETEMQKVMLAQGTGEYAFRIIDTARPPAKRSWPKRTLLVLIATVSGLFASVVVAVVLDPVRALVRFADAG